VAAAIAQEKGVVSPWAAEADGHALAVARDLLSGERKAILLGNSARHHPQAQELLALSQWIGEQVGASVGFTLSAANEVGAQWVGAWPMSDGLHAHDMLEGSLKAVLLLNTETRLDMADPVRARSALESADLVVALTPFADVAVDGVDVLLPIAPFTETAGSFLNAEGRLQSFHGVVKPLGEARPGWKVLRVLANLMDLPGFDFETAEEVRNEALPDPALIPARLSNRPSEVGGSLSSNAVGVERIAEVPIYASDSLVRRAASLQLTADARQARVSLPAGLWSELGLQAGDEVCVSQGNAEVVLKAHLDPSLDERTVRVPAGLEVTAGLGPAFGPIAIRRAAAAEHTAARQEAHA